MNWYEVAFGAHYPLLYSHRDAGEAVRAVEAVRRLAPLGDGPRLDLGCGAGRHLAPLAADGSLVVGLDLSRSLLAAAAAAGEGGRLVRADMRRLPLGDGTFAAVLSLFTAFGYFGPLAAHAPLLAEIARVLRPGGFWCLDYLNCEAVRRQLVAGPEAPREEERGPLRITQQRRLAVDRVVKRVSVTPLPGHEPAAAALGVPATGLTYAEEVALFPLEALDALAAAHGLRRVAGAGGYGDESLTDAGAPRWLLAFRREVPS
jgi:SAM-dependent methyltransferase